MSDQVSLLGGFLGLSFGAGLLLIIWRLRARTPRFEDRVGPYLGPRSATSGLLEEARTVTPFPVLEGFLQPWVKDLGRLAERLGSSTSGLEDRLLRAGRRQTVDQFRVQQILFTVFGVVVGLFLAITLHVLRDSALFAMTALVLLSGAVGFILSDRRLAGQIAKRETLMLLEFPTIAELFALAVAAGESPAGALERICSNANGEILVELRALRAEIHAGKSLTTALGGLAASTSVAPLARFAEGIAVAVERGTPLADVLRDQAQDVRDSGRRVLMEIGGRKEVLMMVPVVFLLLPVTVVFAIFPSVVTLNLGL